jgi:hypothetical protein
LAIRHGDRISWIFGLDKAEQFTPELFWQCGGNRPRRMGETPAPSVHSIQAQNAANGILLADCLKE